MYEDDEEDSEEENPRNSLRYPSYIQEDGQSKHYFEKLETGAVMVIPVKGAITKYDYCGSRGSTTRMQWLKEAAANSNVKEVFLDIDSGGGSAAGTLDFAEAIKNFPKPITAIINGMAASAAYWIASACDQIVMVNSMSQVGSIGAYTTLVSFKKYYEELGIDLVELYAEQSSDKNAFIREFEEKGTTKIAQAEINRLCQMFIDSVKHNRPGVDQSTLTGKMYYPDEAISLGLADRVESIDDVINQSIQSIMFGKEAKETKNKVISKLGLAEDASDQDILSAVEAGANAVTDLEAVNNALGDHAKDYDSPGAAVADLVEQHDNLLKENEELAKTPAGGIARTRKKENGDSQTDSKVDNKFVAGYGDDGMNTEFNLNPVEA